MTRIERIAPLIDALSDEAFEDLLAAARHAAGTSTVYATLSDGEKAEIDAAISRLDAGQGISYETFKARRDARLKAKGA
jgi:hypothetical protein